MLVTPYPDRSGVADAGDAVNTSQWHRTTRSSVDTRWSWRVTQVWGNRPPGRVEGAYWWTGSANSTTGVLSSKTESEPEA